MTNTELIYALLLTVGQLGIALVFVKQVRAKARRTRHARLLARAVR